MILLHRLLVLLLGLLILLWLLILLLLVVAVVLLLLAGNSLVGLSTLGVMVVAVLSAVGRDQDDHEHGEEGSAELGDQFKEPQPEGSEVPAATAVVEEVVCKENPVHNGHDNDNDTRDLS